MGEPVHHEPLSNIGFVCDKHKPRPNPAFYTNKPLSWFHNKHVKLGFPTGHPKHTHEHMWVLVTGNAKDEADQKVHDHELVGLLDNDPIYCDRYNAGDGVAFNRDEVEDHDPKEGTFVVIKDGKEVGSGRFSHDHAKITKGKRDAIPVALVITYLDGQNRLDENNCLVYENYTVRITLE